MNNKTTVRDLTQLFESVKNKLNTVHIGYEVDGKLVSKPFAYFSDEEGGVGLSNITEYKNKVLVGTDEVITRFNPNGLLLNVADTLSELGCLDENDYLATNVDDDHCHVNNQVLKIKELENEGIVVVY